MVCPFPRRGSAARGALVVAGLLGLSAMPSTAVAQQTREKVLVIGIDGVRVDALARARTPVLDSLIASGFFSDRAWTAERTLSGPGWSSMLTGVRTGKHRVDSNDLSGNDYVRYPDFLALVERVRPSLRTLAVLDWPPLGTEDSGGPLLGAALDEVVLFDGESDGYRLADSLSVAAAAERLSTSPVDAAFVYLGEVDVVGHERGSLGLDYRRALERADGLVGRLLGALRARASYADENWLILVSTDHGRTDAGGHGGPSPSERTIFYLASGPSAARGQPACPPEIVDVAVTALAHLGIDIDPAWELDGRVVGLRPTAAGP